MTNLLLIIASVCFFVGGFLLGGLFANRPRIRRKKTF
jgi:hypothetical protein